MLFCITNVALSGLSVAYNVQGLKYQGPRESAFFVDTGFYTLKIEYDKGKDPITVRSKQGFEVCFNEYIIVSEWFCGT